MARKGLWVKRDLTRITTHIPTELYALLKEKAKSEGKTMSLVITEILEKELRQVQYNK
ncbi:MAG: hypothetical protein QXR17_09045 [Candidatus Bathyarchaeia archaeon]